MRTAHIKTPFGIISALFDDELNLIKITSGTESEVGKGEYPETIINLINLIEAYFLGKILKIEYPFKLKTSEFDIRILNFIKQIPFGKTVSYKFVADILKTSPRAVGQALKRNPLPIIIPCHRVIKSNGELGGYSLGEKVKKWLIEHEQIILYRLQSHKI